MALTSQSEAWEPKAPSPLTKDYNASLAEMYDYLFRHLRDEGR